jgi:ribosomal protein S17
MESKKTKKIEKKLSEKSLASASKLAKKQISVSTRGRIFEGFVTKKFPKRVVIEFERTEYIPKYERFYKKITKIHARLPEHMEREISVGDLVRVRECRPLSKLIHHVVIGKGKSAEVKGK